MTDAASAPELRLQSSGNETRRVLGTAGKFGHFLLIKAVELERAPVLSPFGYTQLIWVTLFGYLIFGQWPDSHAFIGMAVIVGSGLYVAWDIAHGATKSRTRRSSDIQGVKEVKGEE